MVLIWYSLLDQFVSFDGPVLREVKGRIGIGDPLFKIAALLGWAKFSTILNCMLPKTYFHTGPVVC